MTGSFCDHLPHREDQPRPRLDSLILRVLVAAWNIFRSNFASRAAACAAEPTAGTKKRANSPSRLEYFLTEIVQRSQQLISSIKQDNIVLILGK